MTNSEVTIRRASPPDASKLSALSTATFTETFGHLYPPQDLQNFLDEVHSVAAWTRKLADPQGAAWLALLPDGTAVAFINVGACKLPIETLEPFATRDQAGEIQQLYVLAEYHNLRLGSRLMDVGLEWLQAQGRNPLYIGVWSENYGAQRFYGRYGFEKVGEYGYRVGETVDREFILRR